MCRKFQKLLYYYVSILKLGGKKKKKEYAADYICINTWVFVKFVGAHVYGGEKQSRDV